MSGKTKPSSELCLEFARIFSWQPEEVFRLAGILPARPAAVRGRRIVYEVNMDEQILALWRALGPEDQERVRDLMERLAPVIEPRIIGEEG